MDRELSERQKTDAERAGLVSQTISAKSKTPPIRIREKERQETKNREAARIDRGISWGEATSSTIN